MGPCSARWRAGPRGRAGRGAGGGLLGVAQARRGTAGLAGGRSTCGGSGGCRGRGSRRHGIRQPGSSQTACRHSGGARRTGKRTRRAPRRRRAPGVPRSRPSLGTSRRSPGQRAEQPHPRAGGRCGEARKGGFDSRARRAAPRHWCRGAAGADCECPGANALGRRTRRPCVAGPRRERGSRRRCQQASHWARRCPFAPRDGCRT